MQPFLMEKPVAHSTASKFSAVLIGVLTLVEYITLWFWQCQVSVKQCELKLLCALYDTDIWKPAKMWSLENMSEKNAVLSHFYYVVWLEMLAVVILCLLRYDSLL